MKRLKAGSVNSISFIRNISYTINSFDVTFEKVVGGTVLTLSELQDELGLAVCSDFIVLNLDLVSNTIEGGEYYMTVTNAGGSTTYLCEVQSYQYNTHGTDIYADSVVLSGDVTGSVAVENTDAVTPEQGGTTSGGSGGGYSEPSTVSFELEVYDAEYGTLEGDIHLRTDNWAILARATNSHSDIKKFKAVLTDSSGNTATKVIAKNSNSNTNIYFVDIDNESINFGDIGTLHYEGLDANDDVVYTIASRKIYIPPKIEMFVAESLTAANNMLSGNSPTINVIESINTSTYNLYAYVHDNFSNVAATIDSMKGNVVLGGMPSSLGTFTPPAMPTTTGVMTELSTNIVPTLSDLNLGVESVIDLFFYAWYEYSDGVKTPLINNLANAYNTSYSVVANKVRITPYEEQTYTVDGFTFTTEGYSPIIHSYSRMGTDDLTSFPNANNLDPFLAVNIGDGQYSVDIFNHVKFLRIQQTFTDGTVLEETLDAYQLRGSSTHYASSQISGGLIWGAPPSSGYDYHIYVFTLDNTKTLSQTKLWIKMDELIDKWYHIDNGSPESPQYRFDH